jgi:predicted nuclease of restriction endonuclease-like (RecB) superfamily
MRVAKNRYERLLDTIGNTLQNARSATISFINQQMLECYWNIGRHIVNYEQKGQQRAEYGAALLRYLSKDLRARFGKGFGLSNLQYMRLFYLKYPQFIAGPIYQTSGKLVNGKKQKYQTSGKLQKAGSKKYQTSGKLTWSHYCELLGITNDLARTFYERQAVKENWSFRELKRQIDSALFQRLALSTNKKGVLALANKGHKVIETKDVIKDPYVFEFLKLPKDGVIKESGLEKKLIDNLQQFMLELGKGFTFVARQFRITIDNKHLTIDLVLYHRILRCFVLIDLKTRKVKHQDIGQMNMYLNYFKEEENTPDDKEPIGIIIAADKHDLLVKYATGGLSNKIFVSKYQLYLPDQKLLERKVKEIVNHQ